MLHQVQKGFLDIFVEIPQHQKGYLVYVPHKQKIISSYVVLDDIFSTKLAYMTQPYQKIMAVWPAVSYLPYDTSPKEETGHIITFAQFVEGNSLSATCNFTESGNKYDGNSTLVPIISEEEMDLMSSSDEYDAKPMSTDMIEYICDRSQSRPSIHRREVCYRKRDCLKQSQVE